MTSLERSPPNIHRERAISFSTPAVAAIPSGIADTTPWIRRHDPCLSLSIFQPTVRPDGSTVADLLASSPHDGSTVAKATAACAPCAAKATAHDARILRIGDPSVQRSLRLPRTAVKVDTPPIPPLTQAYSKVFFWRWSADPSRRRSASAGRVGISIRLIGGLSCLSGADAGRPAGLRTRRSARCRAPGEWLSAGRGAQPDGGARTASRASCGRAA